MSLEEVVDNTPVMAEPGVTRVGLQDDMYAVAQPAKLKAMLEHLQIASQACGHRLRMYKCNVWFPGWDDTPDDGLPQEAMALLQLIPRERGDLVLLGAAAQGDSCMAIGKAVGVGHDSLTAHLGKRLGRIHSLIPRIAGLPIQAGDGKGRHKAWLMLTKVAMHALDFDAKLIPSPVMERVASDTQQMLDEATDVILGCNLDTDQQRLVQQLGCFGGLGARRVSTGPRGTCMRRCCRCWALSWVGLLSAWRTRRWRNKRG